MKPIYINGRFLTQSVTGVQRYALELVKKLDNIVNFRQHQIIILTPRNIKINAAFENINVQSVGQLTGHLWEQIELPYYSRTGLLINLCNTGPLIKTNQIVTIHDASVFGFPQAYSFAFRTWYKFLFQILGKRAKKIITDSYFSKNELVQYCGMDQKKLHVIYLGKEHVINSNLDKSILMRHDLTNKPFFLAVSSMNPNKNFSTIIRAIDYIGTNDVNFVIAGGANPAVFKKRKDTLPACVKHVGYISDEELKVLYEHAVCFIYPSFYEGFGLPPLEAMACGCPVIVSRAASLPEVCGDAALYCDPHNFKDIASKMGLILFDINLRKELIIKGLERAKLFTWGQCARKTLTVVEEVLAK